MAQRKDLEARCYFVVVNIYKKIFRQTNSYLKKEITESDVVSSPHLYTHVWSEPVLKTLLLAINDLKNMKA